MLTIPKELEAELERTAKEKGLDPSAFAAEILEEYLEDMKDVAIAEERYADILSGKEKTIPLEDVMKEFGLED